MAPSEVLRAVGMPSVGDLIDSSSFSLIWGYLLGNAEEGAFCEKWLTWSAHEFKIPCDNVGDENFSQQIGPVGIRNLSITNIVQPCSAHSPSSLLLWI